MYKSILLPIDLNHENSWKAALPVAVEIAKTFSAQLHLVAIVPDVSMSMVSMYLPEGFEAKAIKEGGEKLHAFSVEHIPDGVRGKSHIAHGVVREEILNAADVLDCDLIVMASHRPDMKDFFISPNTDFVVSHANKSVLVVR